jgi:hypothetical protein
MPSYGESELREQVNAASDERYMSGKHEIVDHYQDTYGKAWKQQIVKDLAPITGIKPKNLERRFDPSRLQQVPRTAKAKEEYAALGRRLPPQKTPPSGGYKVTGKGQLKISEGSTKKRGSRPRNRYEKFSFTINISGAEAQELLQNPNFDTVFLGYFENHDSNPVTEFWFDYLEVEPAE